MLGKLIKYEMKAFGRIMWPLYGALMVAGLITGIGVKMGLTRSVLSGAGRVSESAGRVMIIGGGIFALIAFAICVMLAVLLITRFYKNLTGDEGYLMFSLPTNTTTIIAAKAISAFIWVVLSFAVIAVGGLTVLAFAVSTGIPMDATWIGVSGLDAGDVVYGILLVAFMLLSYIMRIYAAIAVGHEWREHKLLGSFIAFVILEIIADIILVTNFVFGMGGEQIFYMAFAIISTVAFSVLTWFFLDRKLNLE